MHRDEAVEFKISGPCRILILTGADLRHVRFAMRLEAEFGRSIVGWLQVRVGRPRVAYHSSSPTNAFTRIFQFALLKRMVRRRARRLTERKLFAHEVKKLELKCKLKPTVVESFEGVDVEYNVAELRPNLILVFGPRLSRSKLMVPDGVLAIRQCDNLDIEDESDDVARALYHRDIARVTSAVRIMTENGLAEPILQSSSVCLSEDDDLEMCYGRATVLGTELLCDTVNKLIETRIVRTFVDDLLASPCSATSVTESMRNEIRRDLGRGLLKREIACKVRF